MISRQNPQQQGHSACFLLTEAERIFFGSEFLFFLGLCRE